MASISGRCEVCYFSVDSVVELPRGEIIAVEVRAAQPSARVANRNVSSWSINWQGVCIELIFDFRNFVDGVSTPSVTINCNGTSTPVMNRLNSSGQFNSIAIEWQSDGRVHVLAGEHNLSEVLVLASLAKPKGFLSIGGSPTIQDIIIETNDNDFSKLYTEYTPEQLEDAPCWRYLDRKNDPKTAIIGGDYYLAQIGNDLIYLFGAKTNASHWQTGMLKGRLIPTGYVGYYKLEWIDATGHFLPGENFAELNSDDSTLTLTFPTLNASIRLSGINL